MQIKTDSRYEVLYPETLTSQLNGDISSIDGYVKPWKVGDVLVTSRKDLSDNWLLCNGTQIAGADYPLLSGTGMRQNTPLDTGYTKVDTTAFDGMYEWQTAAVMGRVGVYNVLFALSLNYNSLGMWYSSDGEVWTLKQINGVSMGADTLSALTTPSGNDPLICLYDTRTESHFLMKINADLSYTVASNVLGSRNMRSICFKDNKVYMCTPSNGSTGPVIRTVAINSDGTFGNAEETPITSLSHTATGYTYAVVYTNGTTVFGAFGYNDSSHEVEFFSLNGISYTKIKTVSGLPLGIVTYDAVRNRFVSIRGGNNPEFYVSENGVDWVSKGSVPWKISGKPLYITENGDYIINPLFAFSADGGESWSITNDSGLSGLASTQINGNWYTFSYENYNSGNNRRFQMNKLLNKKVLPTYAPADNLSAYIKAKEGE